MSKMKLAESSIKSSRMLPVQYRQVMHLRSDHHMVQPKSSKLLDQPRHNSMVIESRVNTCESNLLQSNPKSIILERSISKLSQAEQLPILHPKLALKYNRTSINQQQLIKSSKFDPVDHSKRTIVTTNERLQQLDLRLNDLVSRKLKLVFDNTQKHKKSEPTIFKLKRQELDNALYGIIQEIKSLKNITSQNEVHLFNRKIAFIETLLAQQTTESELMKKFYSSLNSKKIKGKIGDFTHLKNKETNKSLSQYQTQQKRYKKELNSVNFNNKPLFGEATSKRAYKEPRSSDYQSYRYKPRHPLLNLQPLPRSSYKRQFLYMKTQPDEKIVSKDHSPFNPHNHKAVSSIYEQDYKKVKTEIFNHKELNACKNKIKTLNVSYVPKRRHETVSYDITDYNKDIETSKATRSRLQSHIYEKKCPSEYEQNFSKCMFKSEAKRQFLGENNYQHSRIKHKQLKEFQYKLKSLFKA